jgi:VCBS repeat-containing protein
MTKNLEDEIRAVLVQMDDQEHQQETSQQTPPDAIQDVYVLIVREHDEVAEDQAQVVDSVSVPVTPQLTNVSCSPAYTICSLFLMLLCSTLAFQLYLLFNPAIATITIIPKSQQITLTGTVQLGRVLPPLTISQSQTTPTTGHGHQNARAATGYLTFYNGSNQAQAINAGTVFTGNDGIQVATNATVTIPPNNPPVNGQATIAAYAINAGSTGNIPAYDIAQALSPDLTVKNLSSFRGGQDERTYTTVTQKDIHSVSTMLKTSLVQSIHGALQGQAKPTEQLSLLPCNPTVSSTHQPGDEATSVKVTVSLTCSAIAYDTKALTEKATDFLTHQAVTKLGTGYSLFDTVMVTTVQASVSSTAHPLVFLTVKASGTWIYGISRQSQEQIKHLIAGKSRDQAVTLLAALPGIEHVSIRFSGFGDETRLPKNSRYIHLILLVS